MSLWNGNLCNKSSDVIFDSLLLVAVIGAHALQINRLLTLPSTHGVSPKYILFNAIFSNAQLCEALTLHAYAWPTGGKPALEQIADGRLKGVKAHGAILGLLQIFAQWCCSVALTIGWSRGATKGKSNGASVPTLAFIHATMTVFPAVAVALPKPTPHSLNTDLPMALISMANYVVAPVFVVAQFYVQYRELRRSVGEAGAVSLLSLCLQALVLMPVSFRWFVRFGQAVWDEGDVDRMPLLVRLWETATLWYHWGSLAIHYAVCAIGYAFLLCCYLGRVGAGPETGGERAHLLA